MAVSPLLAMYPSGLKGSSLGSVKGLMLDPVGIFLAAQSDKKVRSRRSTRESSESVVRRAISVIN